MEWSIGEKFVFPMYDLALMLELSISGISIPAYEYMLQVYAWQN